MALICNDLVLNDYSDWFLPSRDELNLMYQNLHLKRIGGFSNCFYWSSSTLLNSIAWMQYFKDGAQVGGDMYLTSVCVRAVRAF